jgi:hypothetical protein
MPVKHRESLNWTQLKPIAPFGAGDAIPSGVVTKP